MAAVLIKLRAQGVEMSLLALVVESKFKDRLSRWSEFLLKFNEQSTTHPPLSPSLSPHSCVFVMTSSTRDGERKQATEYEQQKQIFINKLNRKQQSHVSVVKIKYFSVRKFIILNI